MKDIANIVREVRLAARDFQRNPRGARQACALALLLVLTVLALGLLPWLWF